MRNSQSTEGCARFSTVVLFPCSRSVQILSQLIRSDHIILLLLFLTKLYTEKEKTKEEQRWLNLWPFPLFQNLCYKWGGRLTPSEVAEKVKLFFKYYSINRHKMTVLTPAYHAEVSFLLHQRSAFS